MTSSLAVAVGALLMSADKLVVSAALPLDVVGRYMFVSQICLIVLKLIAPNVTAIFPRLSASIRRGDTAEAKRVYFAAAQTVSCIVAAFGLGAAFFGTDALRRPHRQRGGCARFSLAVRAARFCLWASMALR